jgi:GNAT superfamily N-acetyltransferase
MLSIVEARTPEEMRLTRQVLEKFPDHQRMRYATDIEIVESYFDDDEYMQEMENLRSIYSDPGGCVLLATEDQEPVGAVCLKKLDGKFCEMKRLFVPILHRRKGIGKRLTIALLDAAKERGFTHMRLDTGTFMTESHALYEKMGFKLIEPYYAVQGRLREGLYFMELEL